MIKRTLYFGNPAYLRCRNEQLEIEIPEAGALSLKDRTVSVPVEDIGVMVVDHSQITLTHHLLHRLLENNVAFITCNDQHMPAGMMLNLQGNTVQQERFEAQLEASVPLKKQLWAQTIACKITNQATLLKKRGIPHENMMYWASSVKSGDANNHESRAAAYYWQNLFTNVENFTRGREGEAPNNLLNYGYAVLRAVTARSLVGSGLLPTLGIHHHNKYNAYCLADDIMEPYRPYVDELVCSYTDVHGIQEELTKDIKALLLTIPALDIEIEGQRSPLMVGMQQTTASLAKCYAGEARKIAFPKM